MASLGACTALLVPLLLCLAFRVAFVGASAAVNLFDTLDAGAEATPWDPTLGPWMKGTDGTITHDSSVRAGGKRSFKLETDGMGGTVTLTGPVYTFPGPSFPTTVAFGAFVRVDGLLSKTAEMRLVFDNVASVAQPDDVETFDATHCPGATFCAKWGDHYSGTAFKNVGLVFKVPNDSAGAVLYVDDVYLCDTALTHYALVDGSVVAGEATTTSDCFNIVAKFDEAVFSLTLSAVEATPGASASLVWRNQENTAFNLAICPARPNRVVVCGESLIITLKLAHGAARDANGNPTQASNALAVVWAPGYEKDPNGIGCIDIDGCRGSPCFAGSTCADVPAPGDGYVCGACPEGRRGNADVRSGGTCELCVLSVEIESSTAVDLRILRTQDLMLQSRVDIDPECTFLQGLKLAWTGLAKPKTSPTVPIALTDVDNAASTKDLVMRAGTLDAGSSYAFAMSASLAGEPLVQSASAQYVVTVGESALEARLTGGTGDFGEGTPITLDASASFDPDAVNPDDSMLVYSWACSSSKGTGCVDRNGRPIEFAPQSKLEGLHFLGGPANDPTVYTLTVTVTKGERAASASGRLTIRYGSPPAVSIRATGQKEPNPSDALRLVGDVHQDGVSLAWSIWDDAAATWIDPAASEILTSKSTASRFLSLAPNSLRSGQRYGFRLEATDAQGSVGVAWQNLTTNAAPAGGVLQTTPDYGDLLRTSFRLQCSGFADEDMPLTYQFTLRPAEPGAEEVVLRSFALDPEAVVQLTSAGRVSVHCYARDARGAVSSPSTAVVTVAPPSGKAEARQVALADQLASVVEATVQSAGVDLTAARTAENAVTALGSCVLANPALQSRALSAIRILADAVLSRMSPGDSAFEASADGIGLQAERVLAASMPVAPFDVRGGPSIAPFAISALANGGAAASDQASVASFGLPFDAAALIGNAATARRRELAAGGSTALSANVSAVVEMKDGAGNPVALAEGSLPKPLVFTLRQSTGGAGNSWSSIAATGRVAQCAASRGTDAGYSSEGCTNLPNPAPPGVVFRFKEAFLAGSGPRLQVADAWELVKPAGSEQHPLLTAPAGVDVFGEAKKCTDSVNAMGFRVFSGACPILSTMATGDCAWSNERQVFAGSACVQRDVLECACVRLGDNSASSEPVVLGANFDFPKRINVLTTDELLFSSARLQDIQDLVICICSVFFVSVLIAGLTERHAKIERRRLVLATISGETSENAGFLETPEGAYTWTLKSSKDGDEWGGGIARMLGFGERKLRRLKVAIPLAELKRELKVLDQYNKSFDQSNRTLSGRENWGVVSKQMLPRAAQSFTRRVRWLPEQTSVGKALRNQQLREARREERRKQREERRSRKGGAMTTIPERPPDEDDANGKAEFADDLFPEAANEDGAGSEHSFAADSEGARDSSEFRSNAGRSPTIRFKSDGETADVISRDAWDKGGERGTVTFTSTLYDDMDDESEDGQTMRENDQVQLDIVIDEDEDNEEFFNVERCLGTCLVLAHLVMSGKMEYSDFLLQARLCAKLPWSHLPGNATFPMLLSRFLALCELTGPLYMPTGWLDGCDAFRIALLQRPDGSYGITAGLAQTLRATHPDLESVVPAGVDGGDDGGESNPADGETTASDGAAQAKPMPASGTSATGLIKQAQALVSEALGRDDDLNGKADENVLEARRKMRRARNEARLQRNRVAHLWNVSFAPEEKVLALQSEGDGAEDKHSDPDYDPRSVFCPAAVEAARPEGCSKSRWATLLVKFWLEARSEREFTLDPWKKTDQTSNLALVRLYLGGKHLKDMRDADGTNDADDDLTLEENRALEVLARWDAHYEAMVRKARNLAEVVSDERTKANNKNVFNRVLAPVYYLGNSLKSFFVVFVNTHVLLRILNVSVTDRFSRAKRMFAVFSTIFASLTVNVWIWYQRAEQCCEQMRVRLGCSPTINTECRGETLCPAISMLPDAAALPECEAFPKRGHLPDLALTILITVAIVIPARLAIQIPFEKGDQMSDPGHFHYVSPAPELAGVLLQVTEIFFLLFIHPAMARKRAKDLGKKMKPRVQAWFERIMAIIDIRAYFSTAFGSAGSKRALQKSASFTVRVRQARLHVSMLNMPGSDEHQRASAEAVNNLSNQITAKRKVHQVGVALVVLLWALCTWVILAYGVQMYDMDPGLQNEFFRSWLAAVFADLFGRDALFVMAQRTVALCLFSLLIGLAESVTFQRFHEGTVQHGVLDSTVDDEEIIIEVRMGSDAMGEDDGDL